MAGLFSVVVVQLTCQAQEPEPDWGGMWKSVLPTQEHHPGLFYDETDRKRMQNRLRVEPWAQWWKDVQRKGILSTPAVKWWLLGDERAALRAKKNLLATPIWREGSHGYLEPSSHRFTDYVAAYDVLAAWPGLSAADHKIIRDKIAAEADHYYEILSGGARGGANYGNQRTLAASALGMAALTLCEYKDHPNGPKKWLRRTLYEIRRDENFWFFRPGGHFVEGLGYTNYMNLQFVPFAIAYERASGEYLFADPRLQEWLAFAAYQMLANGELVYWGTCESGHGLSFFGLLSNPRYGRDQAPLFHLAFNLPKQPSPSSYHTHIAIAQYEPKVAGKAPPASRYFPQSQTVVLRENWSHDTVATWFAGKDGTWPLKYRYGTYSHGDSGHFVVAAWDEVLAADSGYDHWKSRDYYGAEFHNVILIDGKGPAQDTPGVMSNVETNGPVRHATVTTTYQGCTVRRTLALVRGRYVLIADRIIADESHEYAWQVRSTCPPESPGTRLGKRDVTWPGLSAKGWRDLKPGKTQLTTVAPPFAELTLERGRFRPRSAKEFRNQVAVAGWRAKDTTALFALLPNLRQTPDVSWSALGGQDLEISGPGWTDRIVITPEELVITGSSGQLSRRLRL